MVVIDGPVRAGVFIVLGVVVLILLLFALSMEPGGHAVKKRRSRWERKP